MRSSPPATSRIADRRAGAARRSITSARQRDLSLFDGAAALPARADAGRARKRRLCPLHRPVRRRDETPDDYERDACAHRRAPSAIHLRQPRSGRPSRRQARLLRRGARATSMKSSAAGRLLPASRMRRSTSGPWRSRSAPAAQAIDEPGPGDRRRDETTSPAPASGARRCCSSPTASIGGALSTAQLRRPPVAREGYLRPRPVAVSRPSRSHLSRRRVLRRGSI